MNIAIVGCGLIGQKRAQALFPHHLVACADRIRERAEALARAWPGCQAFDDWRPVVVLANVDIVIVATTHESLAEITLAAVLAGKHVLVEKPGARHADELKPVASAARNNGIFVRVGFNHRHHRALRKARTIVDAGEIGELMFLRGRYGHGGRVGYDKEWRAKPELSGGGELVDQGVHLIDLARWFLGDFKTVQGYAHTYYWQMPVDDNVFLLLKTAKQQVAFLHASWTEWKNIFSIEVYGREGKLHIEGLGGSYGVERLTFYRMLPDMGPPETITWEYPMADDSWSAELSAFIDDIKQGREPSPNLDDAHAVLSIVDTIYKESGHDSHS